ncbi:MAG: ABC transporter permease subunit [Chloroflexi bacterium]|nr:ABC transporter permease subunit [Chloroflexota bacterium]
MIQAAIAAGAGLIVFYLVVKALDLDLGYGFLSGPAGFNFSNQWLTNYDSNDSRLGAYGVGILNTVRLVAIGIVMTTVLGVFAGIARLSDNWLVSRLAMVYVETIRNTPLLIQIVIWYTVVLLQLPRIAEAINVFDVFYLSNRALALPYVSTGGNFGPWLIILVVGAVAAVVLRGWLRRREERAGGTQHATLWALALFGVVSVVTFFLTGSPLEPNTPSVEVSEVGLLSIVGGLQISPEFAAVLLGLVIYTGAFIAEVVRGSIQAIEKGQTEASEALGLSSLQSLRLVILPQAMRIMIPPLTNQYLNLAKNSSLGVAVAFPDLFRITKITINQSGQAVPMILLVMLAYLTISLVTSLIMNTINARLKLAGR